MEEPIYAAGGVILRRNNDILEVLLIHRPKYDDWSFPKGKAEPGETPLVTALREVQEESSITASPLYELATIGYNTPVAAVNKLVTYFVMTPDSEFPFEKNDEVDEILWIPVREASKTISYSDDADLLLKAINLVEEKHLVLYETQT